ncbi:hypothetical protein ACQPYK_08580 [Streptosporangium sp. CA-135522]|uniref:hypothetical protein n=1 Tax=Streptosporangium sp. CA-135522 TaxID=3240072 RepID=UPI003D916713
MMYAFGAAARLSTEVRSGGQLITPASITLMILLPDGTITAPVTPISDGLGLYHYDYTPTLAGRHVARWVTAGPVGADEEPFDVAPLWGEAGIISLADAKRQVKIARTDSDDELAEFVRAVNEICQRHAGTVLRTTVTERRRGGGRALLLDHRPIISVTSVTVPSDQALAADGYELDAEAGVLLRMTGDYERCWETGRITIVYVAGRTEVPAHIRQAARIMLQHLWETQRGRMGAVRTPGADEVWDPRWGYSIPRRALELLGDNPMGIA